MAPMVANRKCAIWGGALLTIGGSLLLYDAYDRRGAKRPFLLRFLPGS